MKKSILVSIVSYLLIVCFQLPSSAVAQPGSLDLTFSSDGMTLTNVMSSQYEMGNATAIQSDGKIIVAGQANGTSALSRYNSDGSLDASFGTGGIVITGVGITNNEINAISIQNDGKIVAAGYGLEIGCCYGFAVIRFNSNGTLDNTFSSDGKVVTPIGSSESIGYSLSIQTDGKIIVVGRSYNGSDNDFAMVRYTSNGTLDNTFDTDGKVVTNFGVYHDIAYSVAIQSDGKIVVGGSVYTTTEMVGLARYNINGSLDNTFDIDGKVSTSVSGGVSGGGYGQSVKIQSDGKIVLGGRTFIGSQWDFSICRYTSVGGLDNTFGIGGKVTTPTNLNVDYPLGVNMAIDNNGKILLVSTTNSTPLKSISLNRYNSDGNLDLTFDTDGKVLTNFGFDTFGKAISIQSDGKIVVAGSSGGWDTQFAVARYNPICISTSNNIVQTTCNSYTLNGQTYTTSGVYSQLLPNTVGCDSIITLNLTINNSNAGSETITACDAYTWSANGTNYTSGGTYTAVLTNMNGCDSTATLYLTINNSNAGSETITACDAYTWSANGTNYTSGGTYTAVLTNMNGCDSTATLNLTINNSNAGSETITACDSYTWTANGTNYISSGTYTAVLSNMNGCDSTATLYLTINNSNAGSESFTACDAYTWSANGTNYTSSGTYTAVLTNMNGCDSTATLNLTINNSNAGSESITACDSYTWTANGTNYTSSGTYTAVLTNMNGCDSIATLNLTINSVDISLTIISDVSLQANTSTAQYQWVDCDDSFNPIINETNQLFVASINGNYAVEISENGCVDTSDCYVIDNVGNKEMTTSRVSVYPNPTVDFVTIELGSSSFQTIEVLDTWGRIVNTLSIGSSEVIVDLQKMQRGIYYLKIISENATQIEKVVKE